MAHPATSSPTAAKKPRAPKGSGNIPCTMCTKKFTRSNDVRRHKQIHSKTLYYLCTVTGCNYTTPEENKMRQHNIRLHQKKPKKGKSGGRRSHMPIPLLKRSTTPESLTPTPPPRAASITVPSPAIAPSQHQSPSTYTSLTSQIPPCANPSTTLDSLTLTTARSATVASTQRQSSSMYATSTSSGSSSSLPTPPYTPYSHPSITLSNASPTPSLTPQSPIWNTLGVCLMPPFQPPEIDAPLPPSISTTSSSTAYSATWSPKWAADMIPQVQNYCTPPQWQCSDGYAGSGPYVPLTPPAPINAWDRRIAPPAAEVDDAPSWAPTQLKHYSTALQTQWSSEYVPDPSYMPPIAPAPTPTYANVNAWDSRVVPAAPAPASAPTNACGRRVPTALAPEVVGAPNWATTTQFQNYSTAPQRQWSSEYVPSTTPAYANANVNAWDRPTPVAAPAPATEIGGAHSCDANAQIQNCYTDAPQLQSQSTGGYHLGLYVAPAAPIPQAAPVPSNTWDRHVPAAPTLKVEAEDPSSWDTNTLLQNAFSAPQIQTPWNGKHAPGPYVPSIAPTPALINTFGKCMSMPPTAPEVQHYFNAHEIQGAEWNGEYAPVQYFPPTASGYSMQPPQQRDTYPTPTAHTPSTQYYNPLAGTSFMPTQISMTYHYSTSQLNYFSR